MKIIDLALTSVRGVPDGHYRFADGEDAAAALTLVTGAGPTGKTSLLEAIVAAKELAGPYGVMPPPARQLRRGTTSARIVGRWLLDEAEQAVVTATSTAIVPGEVKEEEPVHPTVTLAIDCDATMASAPDARRYKPLFARYDRSPAAAKLEYFNLERKMRPELYTEPPPQVAERVEGGVRLGHDLQKYGFVRRYVGDLYAAQAENLAGLLASQGVITQADNPDVLAPLKVALGSLAPDLRLARVDLGKGSVPQLWFARRDGRQLELEDLSASEHQAVLFAVTFCRQGLRRSLVLIDAPERDIPRGHQLAFFRALVAMAPEGQTIAATDSPEIIDGMDGARVIDVSTPE